MSDDGVDNTALLERLRASVRDRRESGQYPPGLEEELDAHFRRIVATRTQMPRLAALRRQIEAARRASRFSPDRIPTSTRLPGGAVLHKALSRLFLRQAYGILLQVQEFADRTIEALEAAAAVADSPQNHRHVDLIELIDAHTEALAGQVGAGQVGAGHLPAAAAGGSLEEYARRIERLEQADAARRWRPWFGRERFDAVFDPGRQARSAEVVSSALGERGPVVDLSSPHDGDPLAPLAAAADSSLGGVVAPQADELLTPTQIVDLVAIAFERLAPAGRLIVSCGAPQVSADPERPAPPRFNPTLGPPLPARYVAFVCREAGFAAVDLQDWSADGYLVVATR